MFYIATPAEITIPINPANYMECPNFAVLYKTIGDEKRLKHDNNPEAKAAKEFYTWDVPNKLNTKITEMLKVQEDSKRRKTKLPITHNI